MPFRPATVIQEAHALRIDRLVLGFAVNGLVERDEGLELLLAGRALLIDQVLVHSIELSLQIIDFFLFIVQLLSLL